jgi:hypothetical protein
MIKPQAPHSYNVFEAATVHFKADGNAPHGILSDTP